MLLNPVIPADTYHPLSPAQYLQGNARPPDPNERGWKDTYRMNPGEVTRVLVRFAPQDGSPAFAFDATAAPGYVWHCHILEHEENDMMHRYELIGPQAQRTELAASRPATPMSTTSLRAPYPSPTAKGAAIRFALATAGPVTLNVYDIAGQLVRELASGAWGAGEHVITWDGRGVGGVEVASGVYFVNLRTNGTSDTKKLVVIP
jgi:hypothetical protein